MYGQTYLLKVSSLIGWVTDSRTDFNTSGGRNGSPLTHTWFSLVKTSSKFFDIFSKISLCIKKVANNKYSTMSASYNEEKSN